MLPTTARVWNDANSYLNRLDDTMATWSEDFLTAYRKDLTETKFQLDAFTDKVETILLESTLAHDGKKMKLCAYVLNDLEYLTDLINSLIKLVDVRFDIVDRFKVSKEMEKSVVVIDTNNIYDDLVLSIFNDGKKKPIAKASKHLLKKQNLTMAIEFKLKRPTQFANEIILQV